MKTTVLLKDINDFVKVNDIYKTFFTTSFPARAAYQVSVPPQKKILFCKETGDKTQHKMNAGRFPMMSKGTMFLKNEQSYEEQDKTKITSGY